MSVQDLQRSGILCPYNAWSKYLEREVYTPTNGLAKLVDAFVQYFQDHVDSKRLDAKIELLCTKIISPSFHFSANAIKEYLSARFGTEYPWQDHLQGLTGAASTHMPEEQDLDVPITPNVLACLSIAAEHVLTDVFKQTVPLDAPGIREHVPHPSRVDWKVRLRHSDATHEARDLKAKLVGSYVVLKGTVVRMTSPSAVPVRIAWNCMSCRLSTVIQVSEGATLPTQATQPCSGAQCKGLMKPDLNPKYGGTVLEQSQTIRIQEKSDIGIGLRMVECELRGDLIGSAVPGDVVVVAGILVMCDEDETGGGRKRGKSEWKSAMYLLKIMANSVSKLSSLSASSSSNQPQEAITQLTASQAPPLLEHPMESSDDGPPEEDREQGLELTYDEREQFQSILSSSYPFGLLVASLCPKIYGHELVKAGICLSLFGGFNDGKTRGCIHILLVGDPGLGKSQLLTAASNVAPRGVYVCGSSGASKSGLTVTLIRDQASDQFAIEAGALVLADQGLCCIDEFDKMPEQQAALHQAMETQVVNIAKSGIVCALPARASILAAANPIGGHFNESKTVAQNLKMDGFLISRFDVVFILLDRANKEIDTYLSKSVVAGFGRRKRRIAEIVEDEEAECPIEEILKLPLAARLRQYGKRLSPHDLLSIKLLKKYISYARKNIHPILSEEARREILDFYLHLRQQSLEGIPVTVRVLESMVRLSKARARLEMRELVTTADAQDAISLMRATLLEARERGDQEERAVTQSQSSQNQSQQGRRGRGRGRGGKQQMIRTFLAELQERARRENNDVFRRGQLMEIARGMNWNLDPDGIDQLNNAGYLLKKGPQVYQLQAL